MSTKKLAFLDLVPWDDVLATLDALAEAGWDKDTALDLVAGLLDKALPLDTLIPGPAGAALEAIDGPILRATLGLLWTLATNKKSREARKAVRLQKLQAKAVELAADKAAAAQGA
ncbi:MAG: hypothetical protein ABIO70_25765 [Pseudomonadota bacterium]